MCEVCGQPVREGLRVCGGLSACFMSLPAREVVMKPVHEHDCDQCLFVGQLSAPILGDPTRSITWDFYRCAKGPGGTTIARYGPDSAYLSTPDRVTSITQLANDTTRWPLNVGAQLVLSGQR